VIIYSHLFKQEYVDKGVQVQNLTWHQCSSVVDCERLMDKGNRNRATGATLMNKDSSRSHSIFTVITEMCTRSELDGKEHIRAGKLNLVDLAGSERQSKTREFIQLRKSKD
jgi:kinesin family protein 3/17